jgi:tetratricopeptide (TPR) repeat protein
MSRMLGPVRGLNRLMSWMIACAGCLSTCGSLWAIQDAARPSVATDGQPADEKPEQQPALPGLRQPGEASTFELRDESSRIDPANTEAVAHYMAGLLAQKRNELQAAADEFEKAAAAAPRSAAPLKALAMVQLRMGKAEGMETARKAIDLDPDDYETRLQLTLLLAAGGKAAEATDMINAALKSKSLNAKSREFVTLHQIRGKLMLAQQNVAGAAESYEVLFAALERPEDYGLSFRDHQALLKDRASGYDVTGRVLLEAGRTETAIKVFEALSRVENNKPGDHHLLLARAYFMQDHLAECEKSLDTYFQTGRRDPAALTLLQELYAATSRRDMLTDRLNALAADAADPTAVRMFVGQILLDQGRTDNAARVYQTLLDEKGEVDAYLGLMKVEIARRDATALLALMNRALRARIQTEELMPLVSSIITDDAFSKSLASACENVWREKPNELNPSVAFFCATVARETEQLEAEGTLLQATLELNPDRSLTARALDLYGMNLLLRDKYPQAARTFNQLVSLPGLNVGQRLMGLYRLSQAESFNENHEAALDAITAALQIGDQVPLLHYQHGWVLVQAERFEDAVKVLQSGLKRFSSDAENVSRTRLLLAGVSAQLSQWTDAIQQYEAIIAAQGTDEETRRRCRLGLSNAYVQNGDMANGEKVLEEVYREDPKDPGVNNDLGYLYADQGKNLEQAEKMIRVALAAQPENPAYLDSLGWVLHKLGRNDEALQELRKACADPEYKDATILEHLGDVHQVLNQKAEATAAWTEALKIEKESTRRDDAIVRRLSEKLGIPVEAPQKE